VTLRGHIEGMEDASPTIPPISFTRVTLYDSAVYTVIVCSSVRLYVRHKPVLNQHG